MQFRLFCICKSAQPLALFQTLQLTNDINLPVLDLNLQLCWKISDFLLLSAINQMEVLGVVIDTIRKLIKNIMGKKYFK